MTCRDSFDGCPCTLAAGHVIPHAFPAIAEVPGHPGVSVISRDSGGGGVIQGPPVVLARICAGLGFCNACRSGRVYLTGPKMARVLGTPHA